jgi:hypothetical protein
MSNYDKLFKIIATYEFGTQFMINMSAQDYRNTHMFKYIIIYLHILSYYGIKR